VAIGDKILQIVYRTLRSDDRYRDRSTDYEELVVKRNRSRWEKKIRALDERQSQAGAVDHESCLSPLMRSPFLEILEF
jgi:hypothetical protein